MSLIYYMTCCFKIKENKNTQQFTCTKEATNRLWYSVSIQRVSAQTTHLCPTCFEYNRWGLDKLTRSHAHSKCGKTIFFHATNTHFACYPVHPQKTVSAYSLLKEQSFVCARFFPFILKTLNPRPQNKGKKGMGAKHWSKILSILSHTK